MTFSIAARCPESGMFGIAVASSSPAVAARCAFARAGVGAVTSQNITDPALGDQCLDLIQQGASAGDALNTIVRGTENIQYRQLTAVDANGESASFSGDHTLGVHTASEASNVVCAGNLLSSTKIPIIMVNSFNTTSGYLGDRLLAALQAAEDAGGEASAVHSAGLLLVDKVSWPVASLRVDWDETGNPIPELEKIWRIYLPQLDDYVTRALTPSAAPSYGVAGDE